MAAGFLKGVVWGGLFCGVAAVALSVATEAPQPPNLIDEAPQAEPGPVVVQPPLAAPSQDRAPLADLNLRLVPTSEPDTLSALEGADLTPGTQPETAEIAGLANPANGTGSMAFGADPLSGIEAGADEPGAPSVEDDLSISTDPVQPPLPPLPQDSVIDTTTAPPQPVEPDGADAEPVAIQTPEPDVGGAASMTAKELEAEQSADEPEAASITATPDASELDDGFPEVTDVVPAQPLVDLNALSTDPGLAQPVPAETAGIKVNRLPTLGGSDNIAQDNPSSEAVSAEPAPSPLNAYAADVDLLADKPLMSIILMDLGDEAGSEGIGLPALRSFPYPVSFAVDATLPDAMDRMQSYRAEGFEVMAILDLPEGATAGDAEVLTAAALAQVPEAVALLEGPKLGFQSNRPAADHVAEILLQSGHGFVTQDQGLNTLQKLALRRGVPSAVVFRDFDRNDQTPSAIRRFLDHAAFRAGQDGAVIVQGRLRADTISALLVWGLQDRVEQVNLVPVSAVLRDSLVR